MNARYRPDEVRLDLAHAPRWRTLALPQVFERGAVDPQRAAIVCGERQRSWAELRERSRRVAHLLIGLGVAPAERVALLAGNCLEYLEIESGIAAACAIMVPLNWRLRAAELQAILQRCGASVLLLHRRFVPTIAALQANGALPALRTWVVIDDPDAPHAYERLLASVPATPVPREPHFDDPHEIIFTSGTTGRPKGAVWTNGGVFFNSIQQVVDFRLGPESSTYAIIDLHYIGGRHDLSWAVLHAGGTLHIKESGGFDAEAALRYVCEQRISHVLWVPTMLYDILRVREPERFDTRALKMIMCGGQVLSAQNVRAMQQRFPHSDFVQVYGLTEGGGSVTCMPAPMTALKPGASGRPSLNAQLRIVGEDGADAGAGKDGEIWLRAPSMIAGYWDEPALTDEQLADDWLRTGDIGHLDDDGYLYVTGRKKDMIKCGGMNIFPAEIEDVLRAHAAVAEAAVIGLPHPKWGEQVCAVLELRPGAQVSAAEIIAWCNQRLASFKKPAVVHCVDMLPRTSSGKVQKYLLRERFTTVPAGSADGLHPRPPQET